MLFRREDIGDRTYKLGSGTKSESSEVAEPSVGGDGQSDGESDAHRQQPKPKENALGRACLSRLRPFGREVGAGIQMRIIRETFMHGPDPLAQSPQAIITAQRLERRDRDTRVTLDDAGEQEIPCPRFGPPLSYSDVVPADSLGGCPQPQLSGVGATFRVRREPPIRFE
jgi:hypothetical protein